MARVLIIDHDPVQAGALATSLGASGHEVREERDGWDGLERALAEDFDLVVTDVLLQRRDGLELIGELRDLRPGLAVIARTGGDEEFDADDLLDLARYQGALGGVTKRIDIEATMRYLAR